MKTPGRVGNPVHSTTHSLDRSVWLIEHGSNASSLMAYCRNLPTLGRHFAPVGGKVRLIVWRCIDDPSVVCLGCGAEPCTALARYICPFLSWLCPTCLGVSVVSRIIQRPAVNGSDAHGELNGQWWDAHGLGGHHRDPTALARESSNVVCAVS